jgi:uncharacterized membrane protein YuzA (DUF378 family)
MGTKLNLSALDVLFLILLIVGGLNWGLVGLFQFDLVAKLFGEASTLSNIVYTLVGISALYYAVRALTGSENQSN